MVRVYTRTPRQGWADGVLFDTLNDGSVDPVGLFDKGDSLPDGLDFLRLIIGD